jgi:hypothetical protein
LGGDSLAPDYNEYMEWKGDDYFNLLKLLSFDLLEIYDRLRGDAFHQPSRRNWVRTFCSQVEAFAYGTKQMLADMAEFPFVKLEPYEVLLLREEAYEIRESGDLKLKGDRFVPIKTNLKFLPRACSKAFEIPFEIDTSGSGWRALDQAFQIRNRLVHPKALRDMHVTDDELATVGVAQTWFQKLSGDVWKIIDAGLKGTKP